MSKSNLSAPSKSTLKIVFLTLFLDLIGFSIIFPLFPELIRYYLAVDSQNVFLTAILGFAHRLAGADTNSVTVLFGGILAGIYSLLQFLFSPFWGKLSDKWGRKPILVISLVGLALSYGLWFVAKSFTVLILGRLV